MKRHSNSGFTLIELLVALAIAVVLVGLAAPSFRETILNSRTVGYSNEFFTALSVARGESIKLNRPVTITANTAGDWTDGWVVEQDIDGDGSVEQLLRSTGFDGFTLSGSASPGGAVNSFTFTALGQIAGGPTLSFSLNRDGGAVDKGRMICIAPNGQSQIRKGITASC